MHHHSVAAEFMDIRMAQLRSSARATRVAIPKNLEHTLLAGSVIRVEHVRRVPVVTRDAPVAAPVDSLR